MIQCFSFELAHRVKSWKKGGMLGTRGRNPLEKGKKEKKCWLSRVIGWNNEFDRRKRISLCRRPSVVVDVERELQRRQQQTTSRRGCPVESLFVGDERCLFNLDQGQRLSIAKQPLSLSLSLLKLQKRMRRECPGIRWRPPAGLHFQWIDKLVVEQRSIRFHDIPHPHSFFPALLLFTLRRRCAGGCWAPV